FVREARALGRGLRRGCGRNGDACQGAGSCRGREPGVHYWTSLTSPLGTSERSEEHTSELQSRLVISYAVFCLKKKKTYGTNSLLSLSANWFYESEISTER